MLGSALEPLSVARVTQEDIFFFSVYGTIRRDGGSGGGRGEAGVEEKSSVGNTDLQLRHPGPPHTGPRLEDAFSPGLQAPGNDVSADEPISESKVCDREPCDDNLPSTYA